MRYYLYLLFASLSPLYGAQPNMHTALTLTARYQPEEVSPAYRIDSCTFMTLPSEHCIRTTGGALLMAALITSIWYGYPAPSPSGALICTLGCMGTCMLGGAKMLANKKCIMYYCCPQGCTREVQQSLPEVPIIPEPITIELELTASASQANGA